MSGTTAILVSATLVWVVSVGLGNASIVDSLWSLLFLIAAVAYVTANPDVGTRAYLIVVLVGLWALRLSAYITWRNWGEGEDRRYQAIRARNEPHFAIKSLVIVFWLQGALAIIVSLPLLAAASGTAPLGLLDAAGVILWTIGFSFETIGDAQLARFKADPANRGQVMDRGLWRFTRHPNYFGDFCVWWGFYLIATAAGGWWSIVGPLVMSFLLLRVSGVALLEQDIAERRPQYAEYIRRTNAFFPGPPR